MLIAKHADYLDNNSSYTTTLRVCDLGDDTFQLKITSISPNIYGNMSEILCSHEDFGSIMTKNKTIELVTHMLGDGLLHDLF